MTNTFLVSFATFFATIGPVDVAFMFAALTAGSTAAHRRSMAIRGVLVATFILVGFALVGRFLLDRLGISLAAFRTSGGVLLLLIGIDMVFARSSGGTSATANEREEASHKPDIAVFPLATPLLAGAGAMGASILLMANAAGDPPRQAAVMAGLALVMLIAFTCLLAAGPIQKLLGVTGMQVITRVFGVLLAALAVQFIFDGLLESGLF